jgi:hypothetical protein
VIKTVRRDVPTNLNELYKQYPKIIYGFFDSLNLNYPGLEKIKKQVDEKKWVSACKSLIKYYEMKNKAHHLWFPKANSSNINNVLTVANNVLNNTFTFDGVTGHVSLSKNGMLNWFYRGPKSNKEWGYSLNRHGYFRTLLIAYESTGKSIYAKKFNDLVTDWVLNNPPPQKMVKTDTWRQLEVAERLINWARPFYGFQQASEFSSVARILMLTDISSQAKYVLSYHRMYMNWAATEFTALASAGLYWPEFKDASRWIKQAKKKMDQEIKFEVYPHGVQNELTSSYHKVVLNDILYFYKLFRNNDRKLPPLFRKTIIKMYNYLAFTIRPDGYGLLNNDSQLNYNRNYIKKAANKYDRSDWKYIITNGREGKKPKIGPSVFFPWAGQAIMRSRWGKNAKWSFFDIGPWGNKHEHNDKLHLSVSAFGHDWLVDSGINSYKDGKWKRYFLSSRAHNVILVDGKGQMPYRKLASHPLYNVFSSQKDFDFAMGSFNNGYSSTLKWRKIESGYGGPHWMDSLAYQDYIHAKQSRAVLFLQNRYWVVVDHMSSRKPRNFEPLWHFAPNVSVETDHKSIIASDSTGNSFQVIPVRPSRWKLDLIKGQVKPRIQGWYASKHNEKVKNYCGRYQTVEKDTSATFAWILYPSANGPEKINLEVLKAPKGAYKLRIKTPNDPVLIVTIRFYGGEVPLCDGLYLDGKCAIKQGKNRPQVACGVVRNKLGKIVLRDSCKAKH